jgi:hypothetical protein
LYLITLAAATAGILGAVAFRSRWLLMCALPWSVLLLAPAILIAWRARRPTAIPGLAVLYAAYGLARVLDLLGLRRNKPSWKTPVT